MSQLNVHQQSNNYNAALKQKQNGTLPRFEEELWRHCCSYYHSSVPLCDLCRPGSNEERMAIKHELHQNGWQQRTLKVQQDRKRKLENNVKEGGQLSPSDVKRKKSTERVTAYRKSLTSEAKERIKQKDKEQHALKWKSLTPEAKDKIKERHKRKEVARRKSLTSETKDRIKQKDKEQHALRRMKDRQLKAERKSTGLQHFNEDDIEPHHVGPMTFVCSSCNALMFEKELHRGSVYSLCCGYGKVKVPDIKPPPAILQKLYTENDTTSKDFRKNIRCYNSALALSSIGVQLGETYKFDNRGPWIYKISGQIYHSLGNIWPNSDSSPVFSQLYVYDREHELINRQARNPDMDSTVLQQLQDMMHEKKIHMSKNTSKLLI